MTDLVHLVLQFLQIGGILDPQGTECWLQVALRGRLLKMNIKYHRMRVRNVRSSHLEIDSNRGEQRKERSVFEMKLDKQGHGLM